MPFRRSRQDGEANGDADSDSPKKTRSSQSWSWKRRKSENHKLFSGLSPEANVPAVGGLELQANLPENILPMEALLFEPTEQEIKNGNIRMIHLNTPLQESEQQQIRAVEEEFSNLGNPLPRSMEVHILRVLQQHKGNVSKACEQLQKNYTFRMQYLPIREVDILPSIQKGWIYWHGRDKRCRPCLVVRACNIDKETWGDNEAITRTVLFNMEFILRYGLVPGRVENWVVIVDMTNAGKHGIPSISAITSMASALQGIYRFRMSWTKIINAPYWFSAMWGGIKKVFPGDSVKKIEILGSNFSKTLTTLFAPNQLEERYGGISRNLDAATDFYPMTFPPGPFTPDSGSEKPSRSSSRQASPRAGRSPDVQNILSEYVPIELHEAGLWVKGNEDTWLPRAQKASLTKEAVQHLQAKFGTDMKACETYEDLLELLQSTREDQDSKEVTSDMGGAHSDDAAPNAISSSAAVPAKIEAVDVQNSQNNDPVHKTVVCQVPRIPLKLPEAPTAVVESGKTAAPRSSNGAYLTNSREREANLRAAALPVEDSKASKPPSVTAKDTFGGDMPNGGNISIEVLKAGSRSRIEDLNDKEIGPCPLWCGCNPARPRPA